MLEAYILSPSLICNINVLEFDRYILDSNIKYLGNLKVEKILLEE